MITVQFKQLKTCQKELRSQLITFFLRSKPYEFCEVSSRQIRLLKINEYIDFLFENSSVYSLEENGKLCFFIAITCKGDRAIIDFAFGEPKTIIRHFKQFRLFFTEKNNQIKTFVSEVTRRHRLDGYLKFLKKNDPEMTLLLDNKRIHVLWNT